MYNIHNNTGVAMAKFRLHSNLNQPGSPKAIERLVKNLNNGVKEQTLLGATGTGKTFTIANVIEKSEKTLVLAHNKPLRANSIVN